MLCFCCFLGFSLVAKAGVTLQLQCMGFSLKWLLLLLSTGAPSSVQSLSYIWLFATLWTAARQVSLSRAPIANYWNLLKLMSIELVMPSNHFIFCRPLLLLPSIFPSTRVFSSELALLIKWPKYWSFSISPSNEYSGQMSFMIDWFDLLAVQGTLKTSELSLVYGPLLTSIYDYWKNQSFD